jgi:hypothetical protein
MWTPPGETKQVIPQNNLTPHQNNNPPILTALPNMTVTRSNLLGFTASAADADAPPQLLSYSLDPGAPLGAIIDSASGVFSWPAEQSPGTYSIVVRATDNGVPVMTDAQTVYVRIVPEPAMAIAIAGGNTVLSWPADAGSLALYSATNLSPPVTWMPVTNTPVLSNGQYTVILPAPTLPAQFYRLQEP